MGVGYLQLGVWIGIVASAVIAFLVANYFKQPLHWYLFILMIFIGFLIHTVILILKSEDENE